jgi:hypothetical protein
VAILDFIARYFLVFFLAIEIAFLPFEIRFLFKKSTHKISSTGEMIGCMEFMVLFNILITIILAIVVIITQHMMF